MLNGDGDDPGDPPIPNNSDYKKRARNSSTSLPPLTKRPRAEQAPEETSVSPVEEVQIPISDDVPQLPGSSTPLRDPNNDDNNDVPQLPGSSTPLRDPNNASNPDDSRNNIIDAFRDLDRVYSVLEGEIQDVNPEDSIENEENEASHIASDDNNTFEVPPIVISSDEEEDVQGNHQPPQGEATNNNNADDDNNNNTEDISSPEDSLTSGDTNSPYIFEDIVESNPIDLTKREDRRMLERITDLRARVRLCKGQTARLDDFEVLRLIGQGAFGSVYTVRKCDGVDANKVYAMKVVSKMVAIQTMHTAQHNKRERLILEAVQGTPFLASLYYAFHNRENLYLIMNFIPGGELYRRLMTLKTFSEPAVCVYVAEVVVALEELHKRNILYRDLKLENILIDGEGHIVVADFGLTTILTEERNYRTHTFCGTLEYMAPEVLRTTAEGYGKPADCWSLGVLTVELLTGISPFTRPSSTTDQNTETQRRILYEEPQIPSTFSRNVTDFVLNLLNKDASQRMETNRIRDHPFFQIINWWRLSERRYRMPFLPNLRDSDDVQHFDQQFTSQPGGELPVGTEAPPRKLKLYRGYEYTSPQLLDWTRMIRDENVEYRNSNVERFITPSPEDLTLGRMMCSGGFGICYQLEEDSRKLAKVIHLSKFRMSEIDALMSCSHENIVKYFATFRNGVEVWIITEYLSGHDLIECISQGHLNERFSRILFLQLVRAVCHLHDLHIIHGDIKPENVVWKNDRLMWVKLVDFGLARYNREFLKWRDQARYTLDYAPPELLTDDGYAIYSLAVDIYGLGATLYTMVIGHPPYRLDTTDMSQSPKCLAMLKGLIKEAPFNQSAPKWQNASPAYRDLVTWCLKKDPSERPTLDEIVDSVWIGDYTNADTEEEDNIEARDEDYETEEEDGDEDAEVFEVGDVFQVARIQNNVPRPRPPIRRRYSVE